MIVSVSVRRKFRDRLARPEILVAPGAYDALLATLIAEAGFEAVYLTGSGVAYSTLAGPDLGLVSATEMVEKVWEICGAVDLPVIADADTGFGDERNVQRTVRDYERAGAAAIQIEDQVFPKRCGHLAGKELIPREDMATKIQAATDARSDNDFLVVARTDASSVEGIDAALERAQRYAEVGADVIFVEAPESRAELARIPGSVDVPTLVNMVEGGRTSPVDASELERMGFRIVIYPNSLTRAIVWTSRELLRTLRAAGSTESYRDRMVDFAELATLVGTPLSMTQGLPAKRHD